MMNSGRLILGCCLTVLAGVVCHAQENDFTQYYLNMPSINPGFTGMNDYLDIRSGVREGWNDFDVKNSNLYLSGYSALGSARRSARRNNSFRVSNPELLNKMQQDKKFRRKMGVGGILSERTVGPYKAFGAAFNFAYHLPISKKINVAFGTKTGYLNQRLDYSGLTVRDEINDSFYNSLMEANQGTQNSVTVDFGTTLYSEKMYIGFSTANLVARNLTDDQLFSMNEGIRYRAQAGVFFPVGKDFTLSPAVIANYSQVSDLQWLASLRLKYKELLTVGTAFDPDSKISILVGLTANNLSVGYSYDIYTSSLNNFNTNTHELVLGLTVLNRYKLKPRFW